MIPADLAPLIHQGDALELARKMPSESVQVIVTSPPYWRMRDYGVEGQWGLENTVEEYVNRLVVLFRELRRVLRKDGTAWVNIGDTYVGGGKGARSGPNSTMADQNAASGGVKPIPPTRVRAGQTLTGGPANYRSGDPGPKATRPDDRVGAWTGDWQADPRRCGTATGNLKRKDLALVPFRLAIALQDDGWWVREAIIWSKPNGIPEPARGRPVHAHEYILLLAKSEKYFYDGFAVRQPGAVVTPARYATAVRNHYEFDPEVHKTPAGHGGIEMLARMAKAPYDGMANLRSVWTVAMEPFGGDHFAPFPSEIPRRAILAGSSARGACAKCGAPWAREVGAEDGPTMRERGMEDGGLVSGRSRWVTTPPGYEQRDLGFVPGCECFRNGATVVPCVVLDPFSGSGTTLQVARELGRRSVGFELNPAYHKISESRPGVGLPDILSWTEESHARTVEDILGPSDGGHILPPETVTPRPRLPVVTLDAWE